MKKIQLTILSICSAVLLSGCAAHVSSPVTGIFYTNVKAPLAVTSNSGSSKVGVSEATSILGFVATGDASIEAAAKSAGITKIHHVDHESKNILGIIASFKTIVYGE